MQKVNAISRAIPIKTVAVKKIEPKDG